MHTKIVEQIIEFSLKTAVRGIDQDTIVAKYMEYLMPDIMPCADELHISEDIATNIQAAKNGADMKQLGCLKACVMKRIDMVIIQANGINEILKIMTISMKDVRYCMIHMGLNIKDFIKMQELLKEEDISEENIKKYLSNYSCFITCTLEKSNIMQNDEIQLDKLVEMADSKNISIDVKILSECVNEVGNSHRTSRGNCSHFQVSWDNSVLKIEKNEDHRHPTFYTMHRFLYDDIQPLLEDKNERTIRKRGCIEACLFHRMALMNGNVFDMQKFDIYLNDMEDNQKENIRNIIQQCVNDGTTKNEDKCSLKNLPNSYNDIIWPSDREQFSNQVCSRLKILFVNND
ncbi:odorant binding protein [Apis cerana cerana]|uniref:Odorant binding protein n=1 Tax=Apis cerana cerana TaxID=94128 RepID=A0A2A3EQH5_APICC|nr:odorant binding protein [Apis cerana cerana]